METSLRSRMKITLVLILTTVLYMTCMAPRILQASANGSLSEPRTYTLELKDFDLEKYEQFGIYNGTHGRRHSDGGDLNLNMNPFKFGSFTVSGEVQRDLEYPDFPWFDTGKPTIISASKGVLHLAPIRPVHTG